MDLTVFAIPGYIASMELERRALERRRKTQGSTAANYEWRDTVTSLTMGVASLAAPILVPKLVAPLVPGKGKYGKVLIGTAIGTFGLSVAAGAWARRAERRNEARTVRAARTTESVAAVAAVATGGLAITTTWAALTAPHRFWSHRWVRDLGAGPVPVTLAILGWDFVYYWNHRFQHESRYMWAHHVVHHSSERYNLSTALRQPVAEVLCTFAPYGVMSLFGIRPALIETARGVNLIYQYWIHTDTIKRLGWFERWFNTPSHHRVHHGKNPEYIDRNHGSILIIWDKLFGTFEPEREPVVYGLTTNIDTFNPVRVIGREHTDILKDVARATTWKDRIQYVVRGPGWAYSRRRLAAASAA